MLFISLIYQGHLYHVIPSVPYLPTLPVLPGVSKFFIKSPGLPVRPPNLPVKSNRGVFFINVVACVAGVIVGSRLVKFWATAKPHGEWGGGPLFPPLPPPPPNEASNFASMPRPSEACFVPLKISRRLQICVLRGLTGMCTAILLAVA